MKRREFLRCVAAAGLAGEVPGRAAATVFILADAGSRKGPASDEWSLSKNELMLV